MSEKNKILVFSHEASKSGAPIFLLNLCNFLKSNHSYDFFFIFNNSGILINDFKVIGKVFVKNDLNNSKSKIIKFLTRILPLYKIRNLSLRARILTHNPKVVISNTIINSELMSLAPTMGRKIITVVHEMKSVIALYDTLMMNSSSDAIKSSDKLIAVSNAVKKDLVNYYNTPKEKIEVIYNSINYFKPLEINTNNLNSWKLRHKIPLNAFLIGSCGGPIWRKGPDIFLNVVKKYITKYSKENIYFVWQGGEKNNSFFLNFINEIKMLDLTEFVTIIPDTENVHYFYNAIDLLISTSREEPFGLTILEAGIYGKPSIAFKKSGGPEELLSNNRGPLIPYGNFEKAADEIFNLKNNKIELKKYSKSIKEFVLKNNSQNSFSRYNKLINSFIK